MEDKPNGSAVNEILFVHLVTMFQVAAMQQLGKVMNPVTQKIERDLEQAKFSIDIINMLKEKTKGNLSPAEEEYVNKTLFELRMNYVDEAGRDEKEEASKAEQDEVRAGHDEETGKKEGPETAQKGKVKGRKKSSTKAKSQEGAKKKNKAKPEASS